MRIRNLLLRPKNEELQLGEYVPNPNSSEFEVNNWKLSQLVVERLVPVVGIHPFPLNELLLMTGAVTYLKPQLIFEWGTHIGKAARIFYEVTDALDLKTVVHSIDLPDDVDHGEHPHEKRGILVHGLDRVKLHQGDGVDTALKIMGKSKKNAAGGGVLFFIDGDHSYKTVKRELEQIIKKAPKAVILLHDTFYQSPDSEYNIGPYKAINDCLKKPRKYKRIDSNWGLPGMTLLLPITT
jgi:cephalosporin hydroxylase